MGYARFIFTIIGMCWLSACSATPSDQVAESAAPPQTNTATPAASSASTPVPPTSPLRPSYEACMTDSGGVTSAMQDCIEKEWSYQDARLNSAYQQLRAKLPRDQWLRLRDEQRAWLHKRDNDEECRWDAATEGQAQRIAANDCTLQMVATRAGELESQLANVAKDGR